MYEDHNVCFRLRVRLSTRITLLVTAWDNGPSGPYGHQRIDVEAAVVWPDGKRRKPVRSVIFAKGDTYCGLASGHCTDGPEAKELVLSLIAMKPGDTDSDYFADYTPEQLEFVNSYGEELSMIAEERYGFR